MNKKGLKVGIILVVLVVFVIFGFLAFLSYSKKSDEKLLSEIKSSYSSFVYLDGDIYNEKKEKVGEGKVTVALDSEKDITTSTKYFKILDSSYYVKYSDVEKSNNNVNLLDISDYETVSKITTVENANLYNGNENIKLIESLNLDAIVSYEDKYLVRYLNHDFYVDKKDVLKEEDKKDLTSVVSPILEVENISDKCFDTLCLTNERLEELFKIFEKNSVHTMTTSEYKSFIEENISFKSQVKPVIFVYKNDISDNTKSLLEKYGINVISDVIDSKKNKKYLVTDSFNETRVNDMLNLKDIVINKNQKVPVLNYHFFYPDGHFDVCGETICISDAMFKKHLDYLISNNYYILTMSEYVDFIYGRISIPDKSILITVDDGAMGTSDILPKILDEYKVPATLFLISSWWELEKYQSSKYLEVYSHGHDLHHNDYCGKVGCGVKTLLLSKEELLKDLNSSIERLGTRKAFCYPFYASNSLVKKTVEEAKFQVAFGGGNKPSTMNSDKYFLPRFVIYNNTSVESLKKMLTNY